MVDPLLQWWSAVLLVVLFGSAAASKWRDVAGFRRTLEAYRLLPGFAVTPVAALVPWCEGLLAAGLLLPPLWASFGVLAQLLVLTYAVAIGINLGRGRDDIACGCLGRAGFGLSPWMMVRNLVLVLVALPLLLPSSGRDLGAFDAVIGATAVGVAVLLYVTAEQLIANRLELSAWLDGDA